MFQNLVLTVLDVPESGRDCLVSRITPDLAWLERNDILARSGVFDFRIFWIFLERCQEWMASLKNVKRGFPPPKKSTKMSKVERSGRPALAVGLILAPTSAGITEREGERESKSVCVRESLSE